MTTPFLAVMLLVNAAYDYNLVDSPMPASRSTLASPKTTAPPKKQKRKWPPVCLHVLGFKGCTPCEEMEEEGVLKQIKEEGYRVFYWDIDKRPHLPKGFGVKYGYPHFTMAIDGIITEQHDGKLNTCAIRNWFEHIKEVHAGKAKLDPSVRYTHGQEVPRANPGNQKK
jgi:hypothetical protein